jgi:hypothetical protein
MRILIANEPRAYREAFAATLRALRPRTEVFIAEPEDLDAAVLWHAPHLTVCSALTEIVQTRLLAWALLYPDGTSSAVLSLAGRQTTVMGLDLGDLLDLLDRAERLAVCNQ